MEIRTTYAADTDEETRLKERLSEIQRAYQQQAQPYLDRLAAVHATKVPTGMVVYSKDELENAAPHSPLARMREAETT